MGAAEGIQRGELRPEILLNERRAAPRSEAPRVHHNEYEEIVEPLFANAGIGLTGDAPHDIRIHDKRFFKRFLKDGSLGLGESYMDGWWDCERLDEMFLRLIRSMAYQSALPKNLKFYYRVAKAKVLPQGGQKRSQEIGLKHYDIGNDLYRHMLDKRMAYSCGYWLNAEDLDTAQENKFELICRKLKLKPGMRVLDVGCGWGSFAKYAAEKHGVRVKGITVSKEQLALGRELCAGLPVDLCFEDYRNVSERFDRIVSVGMFEHVGLSYHREFMDTMRGALKDDGIFLLHTIVSSKSRKPDPWLEKHIFPGCYPPSLKELGEAMEGRFVAEDLHNFGADYDRTTMAWCERFERSWPEIKAQYDERFRRMWRYYLLSGAAAFRARYSQVFQIVLSKDGIPGGYAYD